MSQFRPKVKVGDTLVRTKAPYGRVKVGHRAIVTRVCADGDYFLVSLADPNYGEPGTWAYDFCTLDYEETREEEPIKQTALPLDSGKRKEFPLFSGLLAYFPAALAQVSNHSFIGNEKHNPGKPLQHARGKSTDHLDCVLRHIVDSREVTGSKRVEELRAAAWRVLAELQEELERQGVAPAAPAATFD